MIAKNINSIRLLNQAHAASQCLNYCYKRSWQELLIGAGFNSAEMYADTVLNTEIYIASDDKNVLVMFPGTRDKQDALTDIGGAYWLYKMTNKYRGLNEEAKKIIKEDMADAKRDQRKNGVGFGPRSPHFGFYFSIWRLMKMYDFNLILKTHGVSDKNLVIVGHSLGEPLAQYFAFLLNRKGIKADRVLGMGGPAAGRKTFKKNFQAVFPHNAFSFIHESDIVPFAALLSFGFRKAEKMLFIDTENVVHEINGRLRLFDKRRFKGRKGNKKFDLTADHKLPEYVTALSMATYKKESE